MATALLKALSAICDITKDLTSQFIVSYRYTDDDFTKCLCGHAIKECCIIYHRQTREEYIVGNECINQFGSNPTCDMCRLYETTSPTATLCEFCRKGKKHHPTGIVRLKKHKGISYIDAWRKDKQWCEWVRDKMDPKFDPHFVKFLVRIKEDGLVYNSKIEDLPFSTR